MSLNKKKMVREIGRRTRLSNRDVERVIETLVDVWTEELVSGGRIEVENFVVLKTVIRLRPKDHGEMLDAQHSTFNRQIVMKVSNRLRHQLNHAHNT